MKKLSAVTGFSLVFLMTMGSIAYAFDVNEVFRIITGSGSRDSLTNTSRELSAREIQHNTSTENTQRTEDDIRKRFGESEQVRKLVRREGADKTYKLLDTLPDLGEIKTEYAGTIYHELTHVSFIISTQEETTYTVELFFWPKEEGSGKTFHSVMNTATFNVYELYDLQIVFHDYNQALDYYKLVKETVDDGKILMSFTTEDCELQEDLAKCTVNLEQEGAYASISYEV